MGRWPEWLQDADIGVMKLVAVVVPVHVWADSMAHRCALVWYDNSSVVAALNSQSSKSPQCMVWLRHLFVTAVTRNIFVRAVHVAGRDNSAHDALSRGCTQVFREMRPNAASNATNWDWAEFVMLRQR